VDNFRFDITNDRDLQPGLTLAFSKHREAVAWRIDTHDGQPRILLAWTITGEGWIPFPVPIGPEHAATLIEEWLKVQEYGLQPGHDGSIGRGFRLYNEAWGHVEPYGWPAFVAVEPCWAWYGK
jgi:hypothetical protein